MKMKLSNNPLTAFLRSPPGLMISAFAAMIAAGTILLLLPWSTNSETFRFLDAFFVATSAVCVTGLSTVDVSSHFTLFGQSVILFLIQAGGLGVMTFAALLFQLLGKRMSLCSQAAVQDSFFQKDAAAEFKKVFFRILTMTVFIEAVGMTILFIFLFNRMRAGKALFYSLFHSVSAFCNAGFSLYRDSLASLNNHWGIMFVFMALIILGGLGHTVVLEGWQKIVHILLKKDPKDSPKFSLHAKVVFQTTAALLFFGFIGILFFGLTANETTTSSKVINSLFQSVTARTAGFNTVEIGALPYASLFLMILLMFVGGSPGSCAGGIKTTTIVLWLASVKAFLKKEDDVHLFERKIPLSLVQKITILFSMALIWNTVGALFLFYTEGGTEGVGMHDILFEQISAFATVGLSTGLTPDLSVAGKVWIIMSMFVGRLGPLTFVAWAFGNGRKSNIRYPEGRIMIG